MLDLDQVKAANPIEQVIGEDERLRGRGRWWRGEAHDSLVVDAHAGMYYWNSQGEWGDVIEWLCKRRKLDFRGAVEHLCRRAGLPEPTWSEESGRAAIARRVTTDTLTVAARWWVRVLRKSSDAMEYCKWRGWTDETIRKAGLGYADGDIAGLKGELTMHGVDLGGPSARAMLQMPKGMLVYPCVQGGRVVYVMGRTASRERKKHWNPPVDLVGERQPYLNYEYSPMGQVVTVVEGQADAVTLAQWGIPAIGLAGTSADARLLQMLRRHETVALGLDRGAQVGKIADALGPMTRVVTWPAKDPNEWLQSGGGTAEEALALLDEAPTWVEVVATETAQVDGLEREGAIKRVFGLVRRMEEFAIAMHRPALAKALGLNMRQFNALLRASRAEIGSDTGEGEEEDAEPAIVMETPGTFVADHLLEMVVVPPEKDRKRQWRTRFVCRFPDGRVREIDYLDVDGVRYVPLAAENRILTERVVLFPSEVSEQRSVRELVRWIQRVIRKYVDVEVFYETLAAYYVLFSWLYDSFNTVPYLRMLGDAGTGKSRFIQVVGAMCYRPTFVTGAATTSPIFRMLDRFRGTLILDEADYRNSDEAADITKILNTGYQRIQGVVLRSGDKQGGFDTEVFVVYGPKVIATRKRFSDWALESRCLTNETGGPTMRTDIPIDLPGDFWRVEATQVRNALLRYRLEAWQPEIELDYSRMDVSVEPRLNQVTVALQTLIDDDDLREDLRGFIKEYNRQLVVERGMTLTAKVLEALAGLWFMDLEQGRPPDVTMKRIAKAVNVLIDLDNDDEEDGEGDSDSGNDGDGDGQRKRQGGDGKKLRVTPKKIGEIVRKQLHMRTERSSDPGRAYVVIWDAERIAALRKRFGLDDEWLRDIINTLTRYMVEQVELEQLALT